MRLKRLAPRANATTAARLFAPTAETERAAGRRLHDGQGKPSCGN